MRPNDDATGDTWGQLVRRNRIRLQKTQDEVAKALKVALKTVSRWENRNARPDSYDTAVAAINFLGLDRDEGLRLAGFGPGEVGEPDDPYAYVRAMGLDPNNRVIRIILAMDGITEEQRSDALRKAREMELRDESRRADDIRWSLDQQRRLAEQQRHQEDERRAS